MSEPFVCAVMLTRDRPEMAKRAVECFRAQTYPQTHRALMILDSGAKSTKGLPYGERLATTVWMPELERQKPSVGELRNIAAETALWWLTFDIIVHWDDDDWSHPRRIEEQVALLQNTGADVVGYREMLFWRDRSFNGVRMPEGYVKPVSENPGEAWLYSNPDQRYALGTSLCYWRKTWERKPFDPRKNVGEDHDFITGLKCVGVRSEPPTASDLVAGPRMIARIHAGNTSDAYASLGAKKKSEWRRAPEWDAYVRGVME